MTFETRTVTAAFEMRDDAQTGAPIFEGYASVFDTPYNMGPFWEQVDRRAFNRTLGMTPPPDVRLLVDHEGQPLARTKSGTLKLHADERGLHAQAVLDPTDPDVQRLLPKMRRGDLDQMSFSFRVAPNGDDWDYAAERTTRTLRELSLADQDVSIVTYPASTTTSASVRSRDLLEARCVFVEQMVHELRAGRALSQANVDKLQTVLRQIADADEAIDGAQADLADVLGVPNPDADEAEPDADDAPQRSLSPDTAKRLIAYRSVA